jgi:hypothetical protein
MGAVTQARMEEVMVAEATADNWRRVLLRQVRSFALQRLMLVPIVMRSVPSRPRQSPSEATAILAMAGKTLAAHGIHTLHPVRRP